MEKCQVRGYRFYSLHQLLVKYSEGTPFFRLGFEDFLSRTDSITMDFKMIIDKVQKEKHIDLLKGIFDVNILVQKLNYILVNYNFYNDPAKIPTQLRSSFAQAHKYPQFIDLGLMEYSMVLH